MKGLGVGLRVEDWASIPPSDCLASLFVWSRPNVSMVGTGAILGCKVAVPAQKKGLSRVALMLRK